jgi:23S rRNA pseudouridine2605 synthase
MVKELRLQVALAKLGFASRRGAAQIIKAGKVKVNGQAAFKPGQRIDLEKDIITVEGKSSCIQRKVYFLLNKPKGVVTTTKDRYASRCVLDLIRQKDLRIYPVGRLDKDTTGLLLLTNDGELAYRLTHPKFGIKRLYRVCVRGNVARKRLRELEKGIFLEGKKTYPCKIKVLSKVGPLRSRQSRTNGAGYSTRLEIELTEGRKRQIKVMFAVFGHPVLAIERIAFGPLRLRGLKTGLWRKLKTYEIAKLKKVTGVA